MTWTHWRPLARKKYAILNAASDPIFRKIHKILPMIRIWMILQHILLIFDLRFSDFWLSFGDTNVYIVPKKIFKIWFSKQNCTLKPIMLSEKFRKFTENQYYLLYSSNHISSFKNFILSHHILYNTYYR